MNDIKLNFRVSFFLSFFNGISTLFRLFNAKAILLEEQYWYYLTHSWEDKGVRTFPKGICPKVNVIARLEYELAYYDSAVQRFNQDTSCSCFVAKLETIYLSIKTEQLVLHNNNSVHLTVCK